MSALSSRAAISIDFYDLSERLVRVILRRRYDLPTTRKRSIDCERRNKPKVHIKHAHRIHDCERAERAEQKSENIQARVVFKTSCHESADGRGNQKSENIPERRLQNVRKSAACRKHGYSDKSHNDVYRNARERVGSAERERGRTSAEPIDHSETRDLLGVGVEMQRISDSTRSARRTAQTRDLSVRRNVTVRYLFDLFVHYVVKTHNPIICTIKRLYVDFVTINSRFCRQIIFRSLRNASRISAASPHILAHGRVL